MAEKSSLDKTQPNKDQFQDVRPRDELSIIQKNQKEKYEKELKYEKTIKDNDDKNKKEMERFKKDKRKYKWKKLWNNIKYFLSPLYWINLIQKWEDLLMVIFIDIILASMLFSILYILYIIINVNYYSFNETIFKIIGSTIVCVIGIIIQVNIQNKTGE